MDIITKNQSVNGHNVEIKVDSSIFDLAIINLGREYALIETSGADTSYPLIFVTNWTKKEINELKRPI